MSDPTRSAATRILRPEVRQACYALDGGRFYRCEALHGGRIRYTPLPRAPRGARCWASGDGWRTAYWFTVDSSHGPALSRPEAAFLGAAVVAVPLAMALLQGSQPLVALVAGLAVAALCLVGFACEHLSSRDPVAAARLGVLAAADLAAHVALAHHHLAVRGEAAARR